MLSRAITVALLSQSAIFPGLTSLPRIHAIADYVIDFNNDYSYSGAGGGGSPPAANVAIVGSGVDPDMLSGTVVSYTMDAARDLDDELERQQLELLSRELGNDPPPETTTSKRKQKQVA